MLPSPPPPVWFPPPPPPPPRARIPWRIIPPNVRWGLPEAGAVVALLPVLIVIGILIGTVLAATHPELLTPAFDAAFTLGAYLLLAGALVVVSVTRGQRSLRRDFGLGFRWIDLPIGLGLGILGKIVTIVVGIFVTMALGAPPQSGNFEIGADPISIWVTGLIGGCLLAPVVEELVCRGIVLRSVRWAVLRGRRRARPQPAPDAVQKRAIAVAILVSSAVFAVLHLWQAPGDPSLFATLGISIFVVGGLHAAAVIMTGRLGAAIVSHIVFNGTSWLLQLLVISAGGQV